MTKLPVWLTVPPVTASPLPTFTGIGSPVIIAWSMVLDPLSTVPSTGTLSPGRTRNLTPTSTRSSEMSSSLPSVAIRRATGGASSSRALSALEVAPRAFNSSS